MRRGVTLLTAVLTVALAACGGGSTGTTGPPKQAKVKVCSGLTDVCHTFTAPVNGGQYRLAPRGFGLAPGSHCVVPDVSDYQSHSLNWAALGKYVCGGIAKAGESTSGGSGGTSFAHNWASMKAAHLWHDSYWFVRPGNCTAEANAYVSVLKSVGGLDSNAGDPALDEEVPGSGLTSCMAPIIYRAFHRHVIVYTSPGTNPGGSHAGASGLWQAEYGSTLHPAWSPVVLWQCSDGVYGCRTYVPGLGYTDVSKNLGAVKSAKPPGPTTRCFGKGWKHNHTCLNARAQALHLGGHIKQEAGYIKVSERNIARHHNVALAKRRLDVEKRKAAAYQKSLNALYAKYGHPNK